MYRKNSSEMTSQSIKSLKQKKHSGGDKPNLAMLIIMFKLNIHATFEINLPNAVTVFFEF